MSGERILVVDDEPALALMCVDILTAEGHQAHGAGGGKEALIQLEKAQFDLLLTDIMMPDMDGLTLLRRAKELDPSLTAVIITAYGTLRTAIEALRAGARGFLLKPFNKDDLVQAVTQALEERRRDQEHLLLQAQLPILEISQALMSEGDVESLIGQLLEVVTRQVKADQALLLLLDQEGQELFLAGTVGFADQEIKATRVPAEQGRTCLELLREGPLVLNDKVGPSPLLQTFIGQQEVAAGVCVPLRAGERDTKASPQIRVIGALILIRQTGGAPFGPGELSLLSIVGNQIAAAVENIQLFEETRRLGQFNESLIQNMTEGMVLQDAEGYFTFCNPAGAAMLGYAPEELIGRHWTAITPLDQQEIIRQADERRGRGESDRYEAVLQRRDGSRRPALVAGRPLFENDRFAGALSVFSDLTEVKQLQTQLIQSEKLAALGRLVASLAHEINNPLQSLRSGLHLLLTRPVEKEKRQRYLDLASREVERLIAIVERVLNFYRPSKEQPEPTDVNTVLDETLTLTSKRLEHGRVAIQRKFDPQLPLVKAIGDHLKQVFLNLAFNALQSMPNGGELTVGTGRSQDQKEIWIAFSDTGVGIPADQVLHIFEPFYTTRTDGTGMGLAISHNIVERHGGRIEVVSQTGIGSIFTIYLPLV